MTNNLLFGIPYPNIKKLTRIMRILTLLILIGCHWINAANSYSQNTKLTLDITNETLKDVFHKIEKNSEYIFFYSGDINVNRSVSVHVNNLTIDQILSQVLKNTGYTYSIDDRQIFIKAAPASVRRKIEPRREEVQQQISITGTVVDKGGEPVIGANIIVKNQPTVGTVTDLDGNFSLNISPNSVLQISYIGYITQEVIVKDNKQAIKVTLVEDSEMVGEVVVVGFGTQKKASVVGSIQTVKPQDLRVPSASLSNSFAGRIAGMVAVQRGGEPGADGARFWVRGISTFSGQTDPLIFIDGVESSDSDMNALSPEVIENFSVLKDATATALYGARGANGVILITTRSGRANERATVNIRAQNSFSMPTRMIELADGIDYMNAYNYAIQNRTPDATPRFSEEKITNTMNNVDPLVFPNVDWQKYMFKDFTLNQMANLNVSGGTKKVTYFMSANINNDNGMLEKDRLNKYDNNIKQFRISFQGNIGAQLTPTTKVNLRINSQILEYGGSSTSTDDIYTAIFEAPPVMFAPVYPSEGSQHIRFGNHEGGPLPEDGTNIYKNPYAMMVKGYADRSESTVTTTFDFAQDLDIITKGLKVKGLISFKNWTMTKVTRHFTPYYYAIDKYWKNENGQYEHTLKSVTNGTEALSTWSENKGDRLLNIQASMDYANTFNDVHEVGAMLVYLQREENINNPDGDFYKTLPVRNQGIAGRLTYGYDSRYLVEVNFGYNGSENFQEGHRFGFFPSAAVGYNISNESFFEPILPVISNLKIRGSWGIVGNSFTDPKFPYLTFVNLGGGRYTFGNDWQTSKAGAVITKYGVDGAKWEKGIKTNLGLDLGLFNNLSLSVDVFKEVRNNIFMRRRIIPAETGITGDLNPFANLGKVENKGIDMSLTFNKAINKDLLISAQGSFTFARNKLLEKDEPRFPENELYRTEIGKPLNMYNTLIADGFFLDEEDIANSPEQTFSGNYKPGDIKYKDLNGDGKIDDNDRMLTGHPVIPEIVYGFGGSVIYKNIDFSFFFQGVANTSIFLDKIHPFSAAQSTLLKFIADDYWREDNQEAAYPRLINNVDFHNNFQASTFWLRNGAFLRLKNIEVGYTYKFARIYLSGHNLLTFSPFKLWDPEIGSNRDNNEAGFNGLKYPNLKVATIGLQLNF